MSRTSRAYPLLLVAASVLSSSAGAAAKIADEWSARRLCVLALVYGNVFDEVPATSDADQAPPLWPAAEYARVHDEIAQAVRFYWINSGFRLFLDVRFLDIREPVAMGALATDGKPEGGPALPELTRRAKQAGIELRDVQGVVSVRAWRRFDGKRGIWSMVGGGGGLTFGAHGRGYGISWWSVPERHGMNAWLFCHEFHHQLDALFELSGHPEYWFNHFSPTLGTAADFGEHWSGNAWILRKWPDALWAELRFGDSIELVDADRDGMPDADARVPLDEKRFGSSSRSADTDGDGLSDRQEAMLRMWVNESGFETWAGTPLVPGPNQPDTDGDGRLDGEDPMPLVPGDGTLPRVGMQLVREVTDPDLAGVLRCELGWRGAREGEPAAIVVRLTGVAESDELRCRWMLDLEGDGWYVGKANVRVELDAHRAAATAVHVENAALPAKWPQHDATLAREVRVEVTCDARALVASVPFAPALGVEPRAGHRFAVALSLSSARSRHGGRGWLSVFEPHDLVPFRLPAGEAP